MPHYKNGREAKVGDVVLGKDPYDVLPKSGVLLVINASSESCNGQVLGPGMASTQYITLSNALHAEDFEALAFSEK